MLPISPISDILNVLYFGIVNKKCVLNGVTVTHSSPVYFTVSNGVRQSGIWSPQLLVVYVDDLSTQLVYLNSGWFIEHEYINYVIYVDDIGLESSSSCFHTVIDVPMMG